MISENFNGPQTWIYGESEITCPNCGYIRHGGDSWEAPDNATVKCESCGKKYSYTRDVAVTYDSEIEEEEDITSQRTDG